MFETNNLIQKLSKYERWTISSKNKEPLSLKGINPDDTNPTFSYYHDDSDLVSLDKLNQIKILKDSARTYRMNSLTTNIIMIDIETNVNPEAREMLLSLPYGYGEISMSGGHHLLVEIPENLVFEPKYLPILTKNFAHAREWGFEVITKDHFITFTKNEFPQHATNPDMLIQFLDFLADNVETVSTKIKVEDDVSMRNVKLLAIHIPEELKSEITDLNILDFSNDASRLDWQAAMKISGYIHYITTVDNQKLLFEDITDSEIIETIYRILNKRLEHRDKYDTQRDGLPYLKYVAQDAWNYVLSHQN